MNQLPPHIVIARTLKIQVGGMREKLEAGQAITPEEWSNAFEWLDVLIKAMPNE